jgi:hypothetical protein
VIEVGDVVVHGLGHFALLRTTDPAIAATLPPHWHACLATLSPLPAGQLDGHPTPGDPQPAAVDIAQPATPAAREVRRR